MTGVRMAMKEYEETKACGSFMKIMFTATDMEKVITNKDNFIK